MSDDIPLEAPFATTYPLPFRVLFLGGTGLLCWATNLHGLHLLGVDVASALDVRDHAAPTYRSSAAFHSFLDPAALYRPVYRLFVAYSLWSFLGWAAFRIYSGNDLALVDVYKFIPALVALVIVMVLVSPFEVLHKRERDQFLLAVRRCVFALSHQPVLFCDVVLADIFTSFAKVIGDVWLSVCMLLPGGSLVIFPRQEGLSRLMVPILMSIPYLVRLRQCLIEYAQPTNTSKRPLYNAIKYASSIPVIFLSAAQRIVVSELVAEKGTDVMREQWHGEHPLFRLWLLAVAINSLYSYWWDITNDWGLELLRFPPKPRPVSHPPKPLLLPAMQSQSLGVPEHDSNGRYKPSNPSWSKPNGGSRRTPSHPWGLRSTLLFPLPAYPLAVFFNLILRFTWSFKLSSHLHANADGAVVFFWIELAELLRRWMWVFFRVEWELVKKRDEYVRGAEDFALVGNGEDNHESLVDGTVHGRHV